MPEKVAKTSVRRDNDFMYYIKKGDVWRVPRKEPGKPKGRSEKVAEAGVELEYAKYIYFLDGDGDIARMARQVGAGRRKTKAKAAKKPAKKKPAKKAAKAARKPARKKAAKKAKGGSSGRYLSGRGGFGPRP